MRSPRCRERVNVSGDRLSNLPDDLIHKILSYIGTKQAVETSALASRWRFVWTSLPYLNFSSEDFPSLPKFSKFVNHVLSRRNNEIEVPFVKLTFRGKVSQVFVRRILNYAISHNVQQLTVICLLENNIEIPLSLFSSESLKSLTLKTVELCVPRRGSYSCTLSSMWELPALTTLHLDRIGLSVDSTDKCIGLISKCVNLKNLTLEDCKPMGSYDITICHSVLSNLKINGGVRYVKSVSVVAPQLKKLSILHPMSKIQISAAPDLAYLRLLNCCCSNISVDDFPHLEEVDVCIFDPYRDHPQEVIRLLRHLHSVKYLRLNLEILEHLSSSVELISHQPSPFTNLKSLKIYPKLVNEWNLPKKRVDMSIEVKTYLLDSSPSATFTIVSREELNAPKNATSAQYLMAELQVLLEQERANTMTDKAHMEQKEAPMESHKGKMHEQEQPQPETNMQPHFAGTFGQMKSYWKDLSVRTEKRKEKACLIISKLENIEKLLAKLPASKRAMIQPCFSSLCAEADIITSEVTDLLKMQCDENRSRLGVCFHKLATSSDPSS
ncbi:F-box domain containing protein [Tanacetum coccineum]